MRKLILILIILLSTITYSLGINVITKSGSPLSQTLVKINDKVAITNSKGQVFLDINDKLLNISLSKEGYNQEEFTLKNDYTQNQNLTLVMKPLKVSTVTFKFSLSKGIIRYREIGSKHYTNIPFLKDIKTITLPSNTYEFIFSSDHTVNHHKIINLKNPTEYFEVNLELKQNQFYFIGNLGKEKNINFYTSNIGNIKPIEDITLVFFKEGVITNKLNLKDTFTGLKLSEGTYNIMIQSKFHPNIFYRNIKLDKNTNKNIVVTIPSTLTTVKGTIRNNNQFIGGVKVNFTDVENNIYQTTSNFSGEFSISLPPQKYKATIEKTGFEIVKSQNLIYDFSTPNDNYTLNLDTEELPSNIQGTITDADGKPLTNVDIMVKNGNSIVNLKSDDFGNFSTSIIPGLLFVKAEKKGYKSFGVVTKLERLSSLSGLKIPLTPLLSSVSGIISNTFIPLEDIHLTLRDKSGEVIANAISNKNGYYEFPDININNQYFISVGSQEYKYYYSKVFTLTQEHVTNKNIILQTRNSRFYIDFLNSKNEPLNNVKVVINDKEYTTDTNGFLLLNFPEEYTSLNVKINSYNYNKNISLDSFDKDPNKMTLIIQ